ncbi:hypothetical protein BGLA2_1080067 [Burkholderia gladioli]|nr:hypothetical protein BGLA2_1080067 [Burkholderia gladioli]
MTRNALDCCSSWDDAAWSLQVEGLTVDMTAPVFDRNPHTPFPGGVGGHMTGLENRNTGTGRRERLPTMARP